MTDASLAERVVAGDSRSIARAISLVEDETPAGAQLMRDIYARTGRACLIGVTGPPGAGKSTLIDRLTGELRRRGQTVGIIAVDPTSPFTGGALLGDRVRMGTHHADPGVFIRSMATRGHLGGLARATSDVALVLDAAGRDVVIVETVGVGQDEVDIVRTADVTVVVLVPGTGDEVQALKAGIMEIADVFVVNKADREGADHLAQSVSAMQSLQTFGPEAWRPPIQKTEATTGAGVPELLDNMVVQAEVMELKASPLGSTPTCLSVFSSPHCSSAIWNAKGLHMDWMVNSLSQSPARNTRPSTVARQMPKSFGSAFPSSGM